MIKILISCAFFFVLSSFVKTNELLTIFARINWFYFVISFGVTLIMVIASCAKWKLIVDLKNTRVSFWNLFKIYLVGYFFSNILPSTVGGDVVRSYYAGRLIKNQSYSAVSVFVERFSGIFFLFVLVAVAPLFRPHLYANPYILIPAIAGLFFAGITVWIWKAKNPFYIPNRLSNLLFQGGRRLGEKTDLQLIIRTTEALETFYGRIVLRVKKLKEELKVAVDAVKSDKIFLSRLVYLTVLFYVLTWVNVYTAFKAFNVEVDFVAICSVVPAIMLVAHVPVTLLGNLGYFESVFVFYFYLVGVGGAESLAMGLLLRIKMLSMGVIGFFVYLVYRQTHRLELEKNHENK